MLINKHHVAQRFSAASNTYDAVAIAQKQAAQALVQCLMARWPEFYPESVLDLGTGTGFLPELLLPHYPNSRFVLNDLSADMLVQAQKRLRHALRVDYVLGDMEHQALAPHSLIVSNLALQWLSALDVTLHAHYLNSERLAFSCLLQGTFAAWEAIFERLNLPSPVPVYWSKLQFEELIQAWNPKDYWLVTDEIRVTLPNAHAVMRYLQQLGASLGQRALSTRELMRVMEYPVDSIEMNYCVLFALVRRV